MRRPSSDCAFALARRRHVPGGAAQVYPSSAGNLAVETVARGLDHPWALAFLPDGRMLVTERPGRMRIVAKDGKLSPPLAGVPKVLASGQGGLLDVVLDRDYAQNRTIYFCFAEPADGGGRTALARARLVDEGTPRLDDVKVIFRQEGPLSSGNHFGCRIAQAARRQPVPDHGRSFPLSATRRRTSAIISARSSASGRTARCRRTIRSSAGRAPSRKSGATATAIRRAPRSIRRPASCGSTSTVRAAATRSTFRSPARTTAGR